MIRIFCFYYVFNGVYVKKGFSKFSHCFVLHSAPTFVASLNYKAWVYTFFKYLWHEINIPVIVVCAGTAQRNLWSCQRRSAMSWWRRRAAVCSRLDTVSAIRHARRRPSRSTWMEALPRTRDRTDARSTLLGFFFLIIWLLQQSDQATQTLSLSVRPERYLNIRQRCEADVLSPSNLSPRTGSETLLCTIVYCTVKFKGKYESYSIQKKRINTV